MCWYPQRTNASASYFFVALNRKHGVDDNLKKYVLFAGKWQFLEEFGDKADTTALRAGTQGAAIEIKTLAGPARGWIILRPYSNGRSKGSVLWEQLDQ